MNKIDIDQEREALKIIWGRPQNDNETEDDWPDPPNFNPLGNMKMPTDEEWEALAKLFPRTNFTSDYNAYVEEENRIKLNYREELCKIYSSVRPITDTDYYNVTVMVLDLLCSLKFKTPFSLATLSQFIVKRGVLDKICN